MTEPKVNIVPTEDLSLFEQEAKELGEMIEAYEKLNVQEPYKPNRAQRRAMSKRDRALQKRNPRG